jgi:hypothetical protein
MEWTALSIGNLSEDFEIDFHYVTFEVSTKVNCSFIEQFSRLLRTLRRKWFTSPSILKVQDLVSSKWPALSVLQASFQGV